MKTNLIDELKKTFGSMTKALEILYMVEGAKPVARIIIHPEEKMRIREFCKKNNLFLELSDFTITKQDLNRGYSNKAILNAVKREGDYFGYIAKTQTKAEKAKYLEANQKHKELGLLLGYPECCVSFFIKNIEERKQKNFDFIPAILKNSEGFKFPWQNNIAVRYFDLTLINHFPHSFHCEKSKEMAEKYLEIIKKHDKKLAEDFPQLLRCAVLYTENSGIFAITDFELKENKLYHNNAFASENNYIYDLIRNSEYIEIISNSEIKLQNEELKEAGIMIFE